MSKPTITEFLEARIDEDEAAIAHAPKMSDPYDFNRPFLSTEILNRLRAESAAKREIMDLHGPLEDRGWQSGESHGYLWCGSCGTLDDAPVPHPCDTLKVVAAVYSSHTDYDPSWAPDA